MDAYVDFASVYDTFMDNTPYEEWCEYLVKELNKAGVNQGLILDLGCGTGTLTELLAKKGYDLIGIDLSQDMLNIAIDKKEQSKLDILYLQQDMCEFELYGTVAAVVSVCDSVNYLLDEEDLLKTFSLVNNYLDPSGLFIFDFNTTYKYRDVIGDTTIAENRDDCSFIWDNFYHEDEDINEYELTFFVKDGEVNGENRYRKFEETHFQRGYTLEQMKMLVEKAGLRFLSAVDFDTKAEVRENSERILIVAQETAEGNEHKFRG